MGQAFKVKPAPDDVAELASAIHTIERLSCRRSQLSIYRLDSQGQWQKEEDDKMLYENTKKRPYGFLAPSGKSTSTT